MSFDVAGQGDELDAIVSPSGGLVFGPWLDSEFYVSAGFGFHSNDARGVTAAVDAVPGLVRSRGAEIGLRSHALRRVESTLAIWWLDLDSELVFVGDAGTTEASRGARRYGVEWTVDWQPVDGVTLDVDAGGATRAFAAMILPEITFLERSNSPCRLEPVLASPRVCRPICACATSASAL